MDINALTTSDVPYWFEMWTQHPLYLRFSSPQPTEVQKQTILLVTHCRKVNGRLGHGSCITPLVPSHHVGVTASHILTRIKVSADIRRERDHVHITLIIVYCFIISYCWSLTVPNLQTLSVVYMCGQEKNIVYRGPIWGFRHPLRVWDCTPRR